MTPLVEAVVVLQMRGATAFFLVALLSDPVTALDSFILLHSASNQSD